MPHQGLPRPGFAPAFTLAFALLSAAGSVPPAAGQDLPDFLGVAGGSSRGVLCGEGRILFSHADQLGWNWFPAEGADSSLIYTCAALAGSRFVVAAENGSVWRSTGPEGYVFEPVGSTGASGVRALAQAGPRLVAVGDGGSIALSTDLGAATWRAEPSPVTTTLRGVASNGVTSTVAVGEDGVVLRAGVFANNWQRVAIQETEDFHGVLVRPNGQYVAFGSSGTLWLGQGDGLTWTLLPEFTAVSFHGGASVGSLMILVGDDGSIHVSAGQPGDPGSWRLTPSPTSQRLRAVAWTGVRAVAVGEASTVLWSSVGWVWIQTPVVPTREMSWGALKKLMRER